MIKTFITLIFGLLLFFLVGCNAFKLQGNGELYLEYGTKIAIGHATEKADETQVAISTTHYVDSPIAWLFDWLLPPESAVSEAEASGIYTGDDG